MIQAASLDLFPRAVAGTRTADGTRALGYRPLVRTVGLTRTYGSQAASVTALQDVDWAVHPGEFVVVFGRSGSGKSTLLTLLGLLDLPTRGHCLFGERDSSAMAPDAEYDFVLRDPAAALNARDDSLQSLTLLLLAVAGVALVVGGIGIMNIMLVSTVERRSEIALRLAIGATRGDIRNQFLIEASTLCLLGSVAGVVVGFGAAEVIAWLSGWQVLVRPEVVVLAIGFACLIGVFFGWYPAQKAARMDAIHYELG